MTAKRKAKKPAKVIVLPGVERRDMVGGERPTPTKAVLLSALGAGLIEAVVIGRDRRGKPYIASSGTDVDRLVGQLMTTAITLAAGDYTA